MLIRKWVGSIKLEGAFLQISVPNANMGGSGSLTDKGALLGGSAYSICVYAFLCTELCTRT